MCESREQYLNKTGLKKEAQIRIWFAFTICGSLKNWATQVYYILNLTIIEKYFKTLECFVYSLIEKYLYQFKNNNRP